MGSPQGEYWRRKTRGNVHLERGAFIHLGVGGPSRQDQASEVQMLGCLSFLCGIENNLLCWTCRRKVESSVHSPCSSLGLPGKGPPNAGPYRLSASPTPSSAARSPRPASLPRGIAPAPPPPRCCCCCSTRSWRHWAPPSWPPRGVVGSAGTRPLPLRPNGRHKALWGL